MRSRFVIAALLLAFSAAPAIAGCNPPPPGMSQRNWYRQCEGLLRLRYQQFGWQTGSYPNYVAQIYRSYVISSRPMYRRSGGGGGGVPYGNYTGARCPSPGAIQCNSSGWMMQCVGGIWRTGSAQCK